MIYPKIKPTITPFKDKKKWHLFDPSWNAPQSIIVFDEKYKQYGKLDNTWFLCGVRNGHVRLIHSDRITIVESIAKWKVVEHLFIVSPNSCK